jgi:hypothetical protein
MPFLVLAKLEQRHDCYEYMECKPPDTTKIDPTKDHNFASLDSSVESAFAIYDAKNAIGEKKYHLCRNLIFLPLFFSKRSSRILVHVTTLGTNQWWAGNYLRRWLRIYK